MKSHSLPAYNPILRNPKDHRQPSKTTGHNAYREAENETDWAYDQKVFSALCNTLHYSNCVPLPNCSLMRPCWLFSAHNSPLSMLNYSNFTSQCRVVMRTWFTFSFLNCSSFISAHNFCTFSSFAKYVKFVEFNKLLDFANIAPFFLVARILSSLRLTSFHTARCRCTAALLSVYGLQCNWLNFGVFLYAFDFLSNISRVHRIFSFTFCAQGSHWERFPAVQERRELLCQINHRKAVQICREGSTCEWLL